MSTGEKPVKPTVFVSYSHLDKDLKDQLLPHLTALHLADQLDLWVDTDIDTGGSWLDRIRAAMERTSVAVCLISKNFLSSEFIIKEEVAFFLEQCSKNNVTLLPLFLSHCPWDCIPWLGRLQMFPSDCRPVNTFAGAELDKVLADFARVVFRNVKAQAEAKEKRRKTESASGIVTLPAIKVEGMRIREPKYPSLPESCVSIRRLPSVGDELFGRAEELSLLDKAWESPTTNVVSFVGWGGVGKSALVSKWVARMGADNYRGAQRVFAWSFYSQGTGERVTSADMFMNEALIWFGDKETADSNMSAWDKGQRLAELVQKEKALLLLDGLEPLQSDLAYEPGLIKDFALAALVKQLAKKNQGLCVITTRQSVANVKEYSDKVIEKNLERLSPEAGRAIMRVSGVRGTDAELEQVARDFGCHALAINLLAAYLQNEPGCHARHAAAIPDLDLPVEDGRHPRRVMEAFAKRFGDSPELNILSILGLFDRPATRSELDALRSTKTVEALNDHIISLAQGQWETILGNLRLSRMLAPASHHTVGFKYNTSDARAAFDSLDAHPMVRKHFGERLFKKNQAAWREGHSILLDHLSAIAPRFPRTIEQMEPLFRAVCHGCKAGRHENAFNEVYMARIMKGNLFFASKKMGAYSSALAALAGFFVELWSRPSAALSLTNKAIVLSEAGYCLRALGRLIDSKAPMEIALSIRADQSHWKEAAISCAHLSGLHRCLGNVTDAVDYARLGLEYAGKSNDDFQKILRKTDLANELHNAGEIKEAEALFREAEYDQKCMEPHAFLYADRGYAYCDLLLTEGKVQEVVHRVALAYSSRRGRRSRPLVSFAQDDLLLGRAYLASQSLHIDKAEQYLNQAVQQLRRAGRQDRLPLALLARAECWRVLARHENAARDLEEVVEAATRCGMRLHETDAHLGYARLCLSMADAGYTAVPENWPPVVPRESSATNLIERARQHIERAEDLIEVTGYRRRTHEAAELCAALYRR